MIYQIMNDGNKIPIIGTGTNTYGKVNHDYHGEINNDMTEIKQAMNLGYELFDTAISYRNESVIGDALRESREDYFITTKLPMKKGYYENEQIIFKRIYESLDNLKTDYIDLFLIHKPHDDHVINLRVYNDLLKARKLGMVKSVGVSNFNEEQLMHIIDHMDENPVINQIQINPGHFPASLIEFCQKNNIIPQAWSPLNNIPDNFKDMLSLIGKNYGKTWAQIWLRYLIEHDINVIPKSHKFQNQMLNLDLFDFELSALEKSIIESKL